MAAGQLVAAGGKAGTMRPLGKGCQPSASGGFFTSACPDFPSLGCPVEGVCHRYIKRKITEKVRFTEKYYWAFTIFSILVCQEKYV